MNTDIARRMKDTKRFMWIKFRVQWSFLQRKEQERGKEEVVGEKGNKRTLFFGGSSTLGLFAHVVRIP